MKGNNPECPCGSGQRYAACCRPFHEGAEPPDAVRLMRSRFSAYAVGEPEHLWRTLHSAHPDRAEGHDAHVASIRKARQLYRYVRLQIFDHDVAADGCSARVLFHAEIYERGKERSFLELSTFEKEADGWRYRSGVNRALTAKEAARQPPTMATAGLG